MSTETNPFKAEGRVTNRKAFTLQQQKISRQEKQGQLSRERLTAWSVSTKNYTTSIATLVNAHHLSEQRKLGIQAERRKGSVDTEEKSFMR